MSWWNVRSSWASQSHVHAEGSWAPTGGAIAVRVGRVVDGTRQRLEMAAVHVLGRREGHRLGRATVVTAPEADDDRPAGRDPGELDRRLDRLGAAVREERPPAVAGHDVLEALVQPQPGLVVDDVLLAVEELLGLGRDRRRHPRVGMAGARDADPRAVVEVALAVGRDEPGTLAPLDDDVRDPAPDRRHDAPVGQGRPAGRGVGAVSTIVSGPRSRGGRRAWTGPRSPPR